MSEQSNESALAGIVMAGGQSVRMGSDKAALDWDGQPMLGRIVSVVGERCEQVFVVAAESSPAYRLLYGSGGPAARWVTDEVPDTGPLGALAAGLSAAGAAGAELAFVCATDMPLIGTELIDELVHGVTPSTDVVIAHDASRDHPLAGVYRTAVAPRLHELVAAGERRLLGALETVCTHRVTVSDLDWLTNVNAPEDVHRLRV
ncbi:molybdenum cofactor guanylyltransferase [Gordonia soli]|uniref:Probable molybdenum cofactor guanylyltransferase n=1 Tax=Gordonia soli NBRC 108243 TaxID=1223545 RepID=M0QNN6_9ACTN|nr:molybdenum cofactor guanylyltransferase [Gordonia soli]GAC69042.1 putative molybdenum cofactor guanylyltransferase [Gordonia soli NBRC 108243]